MTDLLHKGFLRQAAQDPGLKEVFRDQDAVIYQVVSSTGQKNDSQRAYQQTP